LLAKALRVKIELYGSTTASDTELAERDEDPGRTEKLNIN
jgi:hypothetical protein